jgi:hypothetical protein
MVRTRPHRALVALTSIVLASFLAASIAHAGGVAEARGNLGLKSTNAHSIATGGIGPCDVSNSVVGAGPISSVCFRVGGGGANVGYANSTAGTGRFTKVVSFIKGEANAGLGVAAAGDTVIADSLQITGVNTGASQVTLQIRGRIYVENRPIAGQNAGVTRLVTLYPNGAAADADVNRTGAGSLFHGRISVASSPGSAPVASFSGALASGDFTVQNGPGERITISTSSLNKVVNSVSDTAAAVLRTSSESNSMVPMTGAPLAVGAIAALLGGTALLTLRRRARAAE